MAKPKFDGVVEAVHYKADGEVDWVRAFERRGPTFSDYLLIKRDELIKKLKSGKKYMVGKRVPYMASTFEVTQSLRVVSVDGEDVLVTGDHQAGHDFLEGVPII